MADKNVDLEALYKMAGKAEPAVAKSAAAVDKLGVAAKFSNDQLLKLGGALSNTAFAAASLDVQSLISGVLDVAGVFATASQAGVGFKGAIRGLAMEVGPLVATLGPWALGLAAVGGAAWYVADAHDKQLKSISNLTGQLARQRQELEGISPWILNSGESADLATRGQRNFDEWLRKTNVSLAEQNRLLRANALDKASKVSLDAAETLRVARQQFDQVNQRGAVMIAPTGGFGTIVAPASASDPKDTPGYQQAEKNLKEAERQSKAATDHFYKMLQAPDPAFADPTPPPPDTSDERLAQLSQTLVTAKVGELQAQVALTQSVEVRAAYQRQIAKAEADARQVEIAGEVANIQADKGISATKKKALIAGYKVVSETESHVANLKLQAIDRQEARDLVEREIAQREQLASFTDRQVQSQIALATTLEDKQVLERQALVDRQTRETDAADGRRWQDVLDGKIDLAKALQVAGEQRKANKQGELVKVEEDRRAIVERDLGIRQAGLQNVIDIAESEADQARSAGRRRQIEATILKARYDLQVASIDAAILTTKDVDAQAKLTKDRAAADTVYANQVKAAQRLDVSYGDMSGALKNAASALNEQDWFGATKNLFDAFETFALKMTDSGATLESKIGAIAGLANGLGSMVGGKTGAALSGAGNGAAAGFQMGGPWGAAVGAVLGGAMGLLGASSAKAQAKIDALMKAQQDLQAKQKESSGAIEKSLGLASQYQNTDLDYSNAMLASLRAIDSKIGVVAAGIARSISTGGLMSTSGLGLGTTTSKGSLGVGLGAGGLAGAALAGGTSLLMSGFGGALVLGPIGLIAGAAGAIIGALTKTKKTVEVLDQGLTFTAQTFGQITTSGLVGSQYADLLTTTKKSIVGIGLSTKVSTSTVTSGVDPTLLAQIGGTIQLLGEGVITAAKAFGDDAGEAAKAALQTVSIDLGKLSLKDLKPDEIETAINALFNNVADDLAAAGLPGLQALASVGEGAFEALTRLATEYKTIDALLASVGMEFKSSGVGSLEARKGLLDRFGGLDAFASQTAFFGEHFLSEEDRLKPLKTSVASGLAAIGQPTDLSREGFTALVKSQNLSTEEGAKLYAALMALAPAFDKVATAAENVRDKQVSIQDQIDELTMTSAERLAKSRAREMEAVKALDASLAPFLETLWKAQDAAEAAKLETDRSSMYADLLDAQGRTEEAKALKRSLALAAIEDLTQRQYQQQIWAAEDAAAKVAEARNVLTEAYNRERDAIQATKDKFAELSKSLRGFSASLSATIAGSDLAGRYRSTRQVFLATAAMARLGDPDAMGRLQAEGEAFTAASRDYVSTSQDYLRDVGLVRAAVDEAANTADRQVSIAEQQLEALNASVQGLIQVNASVVSVRDAIAGLQAANQAAAAAGVVPVSGQPVNGPSAGPANATLTQAQKDLNNASWWWGLTNSAAGKATADDPSDINRYAQGMAARYSPGYMDIVNTQGIDVANAMVAAGQLSFGQAGGLKFATGGGFEVGGSGPPDSKLFNLALSPGEAVNVRRRGDSGDQALVDELRSLRDELARLRASSDRIATSNDKMERTLTNVTEGGRAMQTQAAA